jgi:uncharacterized protein
MKLEHQFTVPASLEETWAALNDLERVVPCFPGATLSSVEGDEFTGSCKVKLGPISLTYNGSGQFVTRDEAKREAVIEAKGRDRRGNGTAAATVTTVLSEDRPKSTSVTVQTDLTITGKPAQFGRGVMQDVSDRLLESFVDCLKAELGETKGAAGPGEAAEPASTTGTASTARTAPVAEASSPESGGEPGAALDLGRTVVPVLARRYGPYLLGVLVVLLIVRWWRRR